ncbi:MAG: iron-sulfur cluster assembly scaffold protein [Deltaproteobacteria bacterium]|nr:iron-sulfur cluster assembly scaffold protein [Deltaproteobacteria bacterium]
MDRETELFINDILAGIQREMEQAFGKTAYERWKAPLFMDRLEEPDGYACLMGICGDSMEISLKFEGDRVKEARYLSDGCGSSSVCASFAAEIAIGRSPGEISRVTGDDIIERMGSIPAEDRHLADLAAQTLKAAARDYEGKRGIEGGEKAR